MWQNIRRQLTSHIRYKIIAPYFLLVLALMALLGALSFWIVANNLQTNLDQTLEQAGIAFVSNIEQVESNTLDELRLAATSPGNDSEGILSTGEAFSTNNIEQIRKIVDLSIQYDDVPRILAFNTDGVVIVDQMTPALADRFSSLEQSTLLADTTVVQSVLNSEVDETGDKYSSLLRFGSDTDSTMLFVIAPVKVINEDGSEEVVGAMAFLEPLTSILASVTNASGGSITVILNNNGEVIDSYPPNREGFSLSAEQLQLLKTKNAVSTNIEQADLSYQVLYNPLRLRRAVDGYFGIALPRSGLSEAWAQTWWAVVFISLISLIIIAIMGSRVTSSITRPLHELATTALKVKGGDLERRSTLQRTDELGTLSNVFDEMTDRLLDLYRTSRQVSGELSIPTVFVKTSAAIHRLIKHVDTAEDAQVVGYIAHEDGWRRYAVVDSVANQRSVDFTINTMTNMPAVLDHQYAEYPQLQQLFALEPQTQLVLPLQTQHQVIGFLLIIRDVPIEQRASLADPLTSIASMTATAVSNALLYSTVQNEAIRKQAILQSIADGVVVLDADKHVILINDTASKMLQTTSAAALGRAFADFDLYHLQPSNELFGQSSQASDLYQSGPFTLTVSAAPVQDEEGKLAGEVLVLHDVTAEREVDKAKTAFIATISHELRTPLTTITGYSDLMLRGFVGTLEGEQKEFIGIIRQHAQSMSDVLKNVIIIASIDAGTMTPELENHSLYGIVKMAVDTIRKSIEDKNLSLQVDIPDHLPDIYVDIDHLKIVLLQLLDNARRYTTDGSITVNAEQVDDMLRLDVIDTGSGISEEQQQYLFKRFQRGGEQGGLATRERGTGLGLAIAKSLVEALGGRIWLAQTSDEGTVFSLTLPLAHENHLQSDHDQFTIAITS